MFHSSKKAGYFPKNVNEIILRKIMFLPHLTGAVVAKNNFCKCRFNFLIYFESVLYKNFV
jgi:hypothetical protein